MVTHKDTHTNTRRPPAHPPVANMPTDRTDNNTLHPLSLARCVMTSRRPATVYRDQYTVVCPVRRGKTVKARDHGKLKVYSVAGGEPVEVCAVPL